MTTKEERASIHRLAQAGHTSKEIATMLDLGYHVVSKWRQILQKGGTIESQMGRPQVGLLGSFDADMVSQLRQWRTEHPRWGAKTLLAELQQSPRFAGLSHPSRSAIANYLKAEGFIKSPPKKRSHPGDIDKQPSVQQANQRWQIDAMGREQIDGVGTVTLINTKDVASGTYIGTFPLQLDSPTSHPKKKDYQLALRVCFTEFGLPQQLQTDRASVFFDSQNKTPFPTRFCLWLVALGIQLVFSRVRTPQDQGQVERQHLTMWKQIEQATAYQNWATLYDYCDERRYRLNHHIGSDSLNGKAPIEACPEVLTNPRTYRPEREKQVLDMEKVYQFLTQFTWQRTVSANGYVKLGKQTYRPKGAVIGSELYITFDAFTLRFNFFNKHDKAFLDHLPAKKLDIKSIMGDEAVELPPNFQLQIPFDVQQETLIRLYETQS